MRQWVAWMALWATLGEPAIAESSVVMEPLAARRPGIGAAAAPDGRTTVSASLKFRIEIPPVLSVNTALPAGERAWGNSGEVILRGCLRSTDPSMPPCATGRPAAGPGSAPAPGAAWSPAVAARGAAQEEIPIYAPP